MAIDWSKTTKEDTELTHKCAKRAVELYAECGHDNVSLLDVDMDIRATHMTCPLKLAELLEADGFNFMHDITGINRHLNRATGELENCFLPRFAVLQGT